MLLLRTGIAILIATALVPGVAVASHASCGDPTEERHVGDPTGETSLVNATVFVWTSPPEDLDCFGASVRVREPTVVCKGPIHEDIGPATVASCARRDGPGSEADHAGVWVENCQAPLLCIEQP
jgi:hypothetical protein